MSGSINKVILVGNLGRDPEVGALQNGDRVVRLSVATSEKWKDKLSGEPRERTEWHRIVIFNEPVGRIAEQYLQKGSTVYLEGQLQTRKWTDQESGQDRWTTEIVLQRFKGELTLLGSRNQLSNNTKEDDSTEDDSTKDNQEKPKILDEPLSIDDDEIPF